MKKLGGSLAPEKQQSMNGEPMNKETSKHLTVKQKAQLEALSTMPDDQIDTNDIREIQDWSGAKQGLFYRPIKQQQTRT
jgi:hypothetical protein